MLLLLEISFKRDHTVGIIVNHNHDELPILLLALDCFILETGLPYLQALKLGAKLWVFFCLFVIFVCRHVLCC